MKSCKQEAKERREIIYSPLSRLSTARVQGTRFYRVLYNPLNGTKQLGGFCE